MAIGALQYCLNQSKRLRNNQATTIVGGIGGVPNLKAAPEPPRPSTLLKLTNLSLFDDGVDEYASILYKIVHVIRIGIWEYVVMLVFEHVSYLLLDRLCQIRRPSALFQHSEDGVAAG